MRKLLVILILLIAACEHKTKNYSQISFAHQTPVMFKAPKLEVVFEYQTPLKDPYVEHLFPITIEQSIRNWVNDRIKISGEGEKVLRIIVKDASVIKSKFVSKSNDKKSLLIKDPAEVYEANLEIILEFSSDNNIFPTNMMTISTNCIKTLPEGASLINREEIFYQISEQLMDMTNREFDKNVKNYLGEFITYPNIVP